MADIKNTRAKIWLNTSEVHQILDLPASVQVLAIKGSFDPPGIAVVVHSEDLPEQPIDAELPYLHGSLTRECVVVDDKLYSRWAWSPDAEDIFGTKAVAV